MYSLENVMLRLYTSAIMNSYTSIISESFFSSYVPIRASSCLNIFCSIKKKYLRTKNYDTISFCASYPFNILSLWVRVASPSKISPAWYVDAHKIGSSADLEIFNLYRLIFLFLLPREINLRINCRILSVDITHENPILDASNAYGRGYKSVLEGNRYYTCKCWFSTSRSTAQ